MQACLLISMIILRLSVKVKMHELIFVHVIIVSDLYFAVLIKEHKLGWLQQGRALENQLSVQYHLSINAESYLGVVLKPFT